MGRIAPVSLSEGRVVDLVIELLHHPNDLGVQRLVFIEVDLEVVTVDDVVPVALHVFHYNFCRIHTSLKRTPAMAAGVTDRLWTLSDLFG